MPGVVDAETIGALVVGIDGPVNVLELDALLA